MLPVLLEQARRHATAPYGGRPRKMAASLPYFPHRYRAERPMNALLCRISENSYTFQRTTRAIPGLPRHRLFASKLAPTSRNRNDRQKCPNPENTKATRRWPLSIVQ